MLANMASSLIKHKRINTTVAKAKALRVYVEPLITKSKTDTTHSRRIVFRYLRDKYAVAELFRDVTPKVADRPGGYTRILKTGNRLGDNAEMCLMELVDFNETMLAEPKTKKTKARPRRRGKKKPIESDIESAKVKEEQIKAEKDQLQAKEEKPSADKTNQETKKETKAATKDKKSKSD